MSRKEIILGVIGIIVMTICMLLAGAVDGEEKMYLTVEPHPTLQSRVIHW